MFRPDDEALQRLGVFEMGREEIADGGDARLAANELDIGAAAPLARRAGQLREIDIACQRFSARMHLEDFQPCFRLGQRQFQQEIETTRPEQCLVDNVHAVRRRQYDDAFQFLHAVHLREKLRDCAVRHPRSPRRRGAAPCVDLIEEDDARRRLLGLVENVAHPPLGLADASVIKAGPLTEMKFTPLSVATALARSVLPTPGGPYSKIPWGGGRPPAGTDRGALSGHSTDSFEDAASPSSRPPTSPQRDVGHLDEHLADRRGLDLARARPGSRPCRTVELSSSS